MGARLEALRGGQTYSIWIANMADSKVKEIPRKNTNDEQPMWIGDKIYYLSDSAAPLASIATTRAPAR